ncbi:hypothetical protein Q7A53_16915 [Halobacillus rhizosphaerae]|uniref:hypothetical protein n=1 Tax=Halobacillus rhizosphaerae TaxID=3064889 RepID=UPI00398B78EF
MLSKRKTTLGNWLAYLGLLIFAVGFSFSEIIGIEGTPHLLESASIPLGVIGLLMLITSNFFTKKSSDHLN